MGLRRDGRLHVGKEAVSDRESKEWPAVLLGRVQRFGDVEYFDVPEEDADEYETQRYLPESVLEDRELKLLDAINDAHEEGALAPGMECDCEHCERLRELRRALTERGER